MKEAQKHLHSCNSSNKHTLSGLCGSILSGISRRQKYAKHPQPYALNQLVCELSNNEANDSAEDSGSDAQSAAAFLDNVPALITP